MYRSLALVSATVVALLSSAIGAPASSEESDRVRTPGGLISKSNIHLIPAGANLRQDGKDVHILDAAGQLLKRVTGSPRSNSSLSARYIDGWIGDAYWINPSGIIRELTATFVVPPHPDTDNDQLLYLFPGFQTSSPATILQPVLQWGVSPAGGSTNQWSIASWHVSTELDYAFHTDLINVNPGRILTGQLTGAITMNPPGFTNYISRFVGILGTQFTFTTRTDVFNSICVALEAYGTTADTDYPDGTTSFTNIAASSSSVAAGSVRWTIRDHDTTDPIFTTVDANTGSLGQVTVHYGH